MVSMKKEYQTMRELKRLRSIRGSGTELISIYVPPGSSISDATGKLKDERGQASNIKSKTTRTNVQSAIDKIVQYLKLYKQPPVNGLVIFCGNISSEQAKPDIELFSIEPPAPIKTNIYRCDSTFLLEPIEVMMETTELYALVVLDGREATLALLKGTHVIVDKKIRSFAHAKIKKGGQSANRYSRLIEESTEDYYKRVAYAVNELYAKNGFKIKGLLVGGPGPSKENFVKAGALNYQIKVLGTFDTGYTDENEGINELLEKSKEVLEEQAAIQERKVMERFMNEVARGGLAVYGYEKVKDALLANNVARLILSEGLDLYEVSYKCSNCGAEFSAIERPGEGRTKHEDGGTLDVTGRKDAVEELIDLADQRGIEITFISDESQYGKQLIMGFGGAAAMLKYKQ